MPNTPASSRNPLLLAGLATVATLLIVVGPALFVREVNQRSHAAAQAVNHTHAVRATVNALMFSLRNRESAALGYASGVDSQIVRDRLSDSARDIPAELEKLTRLTRDDPEQQLRVGRLSSMVEQRGLTIDTILNKPPGNATRQDVEWLLERNQLREVSNEIADTEQALLGVRQEEAAALARHANAVGWGAIFAQLAMLGLLGLGLGMQLRQRRAAEEEAQRSNLRAQAVLQTVREPVAVLDRDLRIVMHNPAFTELFAVVDDITGRPLHDIGGGWAVPETRQRLTDVLQRGRELWDHEIHFRDAEGVERSFMVNALRMVLPDSSDQVALVTANDVSAQKAAEREVLELNRQLQGKVDQVSEVNRELEAFSYSVSHDLRAPLRHIGGFADKLRRHLGAHNDEKTEHYLGIITNSALRMSRLIDDLLVYSRLGRSALRLQPVDQQSLVEEIRAMLDANNANDNPGHQLEWRIQPLPILVGDENMLRQLWLNLLSNAVKYSAGSEPAIIEVSHKRTADGGYEFVVADNGVGFDMAYAGKLFGVFQRLHSVKEFEGTGIGLASVRRVLARHGGEIRADATPGQGARFTFTLPAAGDVPPTDTTA
ncbi:CHASE3 domain-containing protein [Thermomonas brevis]